MNNSTILQAQPDYDLVVFRANIDQDTGEKDAEYVYAPLIVWAIDHHLDLVDAVAANGMHYVQDEHDRDQFDFRAIRAPDGSFSMEQQTFSDFDSWRKYIKAMMVAQLKREDDLEMEKFRQSQQ